MGHEAMSQVPRAAAAGNEWVV